MGKLMWVFLEAWMLCCRATPHVEAMGNDDFTEPYIVCSLRITISKCLQVLFFSLQYVLLFVVRC